MKRLTNEELQEALDDLVGMVQAVKLTGLSQPTLWRWVEAGFLPAFTVQGRKFLQRSEMERLRAHGMLRPGGHRAHPRVLGGHRIKGGGHGRK